MKSIGYLVTTTDLNTMVTAKSGTIANDSYCRTKDYISTNYNVDTSANPYSTYATNRYPRYQDVVPICPSCTFGVSIGNTGNCSAGTAPKYIIVVSNCGNYELRLQAMGNGAVDTAWQSYCCSGGPVTFTFNGTAVGTYRVEIRPKITTGTCTSQYSSNFNVCCSTNANWVNNGSTYCGNGSNGIVCHLYQPQVDTNFCSSTYNQTQNVDLGLNDGCGSWTYSTYCANYGVYPFQLRSHETNTCTGNTRNDAFVADLSPTCGYSCSYWGLSVSYNSQYCSGTTSTSGVVTLNANATNGSFQVRLVSVGSGVTTGWQSGTTFTGVADGQYYAEIRSTGDNGCTASTGYPYIFVSCYVAPTTTTTTTPAPTTTTTTTLCTPTTYYALNACSPATGTAYTTIAPGGINQQYVLPFPTTTYYVYGGSTTSSCTPPSGYNGSIQIASGQYSCP